MCPLYAPLGKNLRSGHLQYFQNSTSPVSASLAMVAEWAHSLTSSLPSATLLFIAPRLHHSLRRLMCFYNFKCRQSPTTEMNFLLTICDHHEPPISSIRAHRFSSQSMLYNKVSRDPSSHPCLIWKPILTLIYKVILRHLLTI